MHVTHLLNSNYGSSIEGTTRRREPVACKVKSIEKCRRLIGCKAAVVPERCGDDVSAHIDISFPPVVMGNIQHIATVDRFSVTSLFAGHQLCWPVMDLGERRRTKAPATLQGYCGSKESLDSLANTAASISGDPLETRMCGINEGRGQNWSAVDRV
ncbi:hypothetical protein Tco_0005197 [Tanacetum coccineum]